MGGGQKPSLVYVNHVLVRHISILLSASLLVLGPTSTGGLFNRGALQRPTRFQQ